MRLCFLWLFRVCVLGVCALHCLGLSLFCVFVELLLFFLFGALCAWSFVCLLHIVRSSLLDCVCLCWLCAFVLSFVSVCACVFVMSVVVSFWYVCFVVCLLLMLFGLLCV